MMRLKNFLLIQLTWILTLNNRLVLIDRFHSRDQYLDYRCYAAILVYLNGKQTGSVLRVEHGFVYDRWLWQQKWTR